METIQNRRRPLGQWNWRSISITTILAVTFLLALASLLLFRATALSDLNLEAGSVAPQDIQAPFGLTYESQVLTERQRENAASAILPVYTPASTQIARQQSERLRATLTFISTVRADQFATMEEKLADLLMIGEGALSAETALNLLDLSSEMWLHVQEEAILVLEQVQRSNIRPSQVDDTLRNIPNLVSLSLTDNQTEIVAELVGLYVVPNSFYSEELTEARRQQAIDAVPPVERSFLAGEIIIQGGRVLQESDIEALEAFGLLQPEDNQLVAVQAGVIVVIAFVIAFIFLRRNRSLWQSYRLIFFLSVAFLLFLIPARILVLGHVVIPFIYPVAAFGMLLTSFFGLMPGMVLPISLSLLITFGMPNALELTLYYTFSTIFGVMMLGSSQRIISFFWAGIAAAAIGGALVITNRLLDPLTDLNGLATLSGAALVYGLISSGLAILLQFLTARWLGKTTNLQLVELSRPEHPLLRQILLKAPGTYQHSLQVANLAELAAERVEADPLLTRVGALYHDAGKSENPQYFIENQIEGTPNLHDALTPLESAEIIISHVTDGVKLAKKHRLPRPIINFILEHHGTMLTSFQYVKALNQAEGNTDAINKQDYSYPGPRPNSKETALVMLADGCEARARAERPGSEEALRKMIKETIDTRISDRQLDKVPFTPKDLNIILDVFTSTLKGVYHPRIAYPKLDASRVQSSSRGAGHDNIFTEPPEPEPASKLGKDD